MLAFEQTVTTVSSCTMQPTKALTGLDGLEGFGVAGRNVFGE
jgi:hypothetical protein